MFKTSAVRGDDANIFFRNLATQSGTTPKWNFYKYLIDANGKVIESYGSKTTPEDEELVAKIESLLK
jgi:glutathione peroxidase